MEATVFEVHLIIAGGLDVVRVHLQKTPISVLTMKEGAAEQRCLELTRQAHSPSLPCFFCLCRPAALK